MLNEGKCSRIDMAMNDKTGKIIPFGKILDAVKNGYVSSRWRTSTEYVKHKLMDGEVIGHTINIGYRKTKMYMCIYDKAMEQELDTPWYRIEMEIRDARAEVLQNTLLFEDNIGQVFSKIINNYIRYLEPDTNINKARWSTRPGGTI
jgi:DNA relaxase NicK